MLKLSVLLLVGTWLSFPEIHTVIVFLCDLASSLNVNCFPALCFLTSKGMTVANCDAQ